MEPPRNPADRRPGGKPASIPPTCPTCGADLVLLDALTVPRKPREEWWEDEFICPNHQADGIFIDAPEGAY